MSPDFSTDFREQPVDVKTAARFFGVNPSLVYSYVERKQIPHYRMMGRAIRFTLFRTGEVAAAIPRRWRDQ